MSKAGQAKTVLEQNSRGAWTRPAPALYPHQWLWDSCFVAIGLATYWPDRAAAELQSLLRGQWRNGMLPHIIFSGGGRYWLDARFWRSNRSALAPNHLATSGLTQPPLPAVAALAVAKRLGGDAADQFRRNVFPPLLAYHEWLYRERDPDGRGLISLIHPWESGLDNTPPWARLLNQLPAPLWVGLVEHLGLDRFLRLFRIDTRLVPPSQRPTNHEALTAIGLARVYRRQRYDSRKIFEHPKIAIESLTTNCILIAANRALTELAASAGEVIPEDLANRMALSEQGLEQLYDPATQQYYARNRLTGELIRDASISTFFPLYTGCITPERADSLVKLLGDPASYRSPYPVPSVPLDSPEFNEQRYWQGPTWINTNWFIIQGLKKYGYESEAADLTKRTLDLVEQAGFWEYFSPLSGQGYGSDNFSWTAALYLDLLKPIG